MKDILEHVNKFALGIWNDDFSLKLLLAALALMDIYARGGGSIITLSKIGLAYAIAEFFVIDKNSRK